MSIDPQAITTLKRRDPTLGRIIDRVGPCTLRPQKPYFAALCEAIIAQQLSIKAAATIYRRFRGLFHGRTPTPERLGALSDADLQAVGLSRQKIGYLRDLVRKFADRTVPYWRLSTLDENTVITALTQVKGIGVWTAQMFLIFSLNRPDVLPVGDLGLRKAVELWYELDGLPAEAELIKIGKCWRPYRTVATWYLWQSLDNRPLRS
ncbi:MAG: DNA-3-methyladenine glycosylase 2 family protein [Phycisphaerales bacterium]|nr:MAG: DNA-3-methyladenine glycosylase 2 family protein [Phycisphaerales bacterium]